MRITMSAPSIIAIMVFGKASLGEPFPVQSHQLCTGNLSIAVPGECTVSSFSVMLCFLAAPRECYYTNRAGGVGVTVWDLTGQADVTVAGLNGGSPIPFSVQGSYVWVTRLDITGLEWFVGEPTPTEPTPSGRLVGTNPTFGTIGMRIVDGSGHVLNNLSIVGQLQVEFSEAQDLYDGEGSGAHLSPFAAVSGSASSNPNADSDGDGVVDNMDNARCVANPSQLDPDVDGLGSVIDICPSDPSDTCAIGSCCLVGGECEESAQDACAAGEGLYGGDSTACAPGLCAGGIPGPAISEWGLVVLVLLSLTIGTIAFLHRPLGGPFQSSA